VLYRVPILSGKVLIIIIIIIIIKVVIDVTTMVQRQLIVKSRVRNFILYFGLIIYSEVPIYMYICIPRDWGTSLSAPSDFIRGVSFGNNFPPQRPRIYRFRTRLATGKSNQNTDVHNFSPEFFFFWIFFSKPFF